MNSDLLSRSNQSGPSTVDVMDLGERFSRLLTVTGAAVSVFVLSSAYAAASGSGDTNSGDTSAGGEGGCGDCEEPASDDGLTDVCQDEGDCDCNTGGSQQGGHDNAGPPLGGLRPVAWDTGEKWELESDLYVSLPGKDFRLTRQYSSLSTLALDPYASQLIGSAGVGGASIPTLIDAPRVGAGWGLSNLRGVRYRQSWDCVEDGMCTVTPCEEEPCADINYTLQYNGATAWLLRPARKPREFNMPGGISNLTSSATAGGPGNQSFSLVSYSGGNYGSASSSTRYSLCDTCTFPDGIILDGAVRLSEPGRWHQDFAVKNGVGWISKDVDEYGNKRVYKDIDSDNIPDTIYLNGDSDNDAMAWVELFWEDIVGNPVLVRAEVWRPDGMSSVRTQIVEYWHLVDESGTLRVKRHNGSNYVVVEDPSTLLALVPSNDLGTEHDLVQVVRRSLVDPLNSSDHRIEVTQYRYHDGASPWDDGDLDESGSVPDIRLDIDGLPHQLKSIINAEQIEHIAQKRNAGSGASPETVVVEATELLAKRDQDEAFNDGSSVAIYKTVSKLVDYDLFSIDERVEAQILQNEGCGCGSGGAASAVVRTYEWIDWTTTEFGGTLNGTSMHMRELAVSTFTAWPSTVYRTTCQDMIKLKKGSKEYPYPWLLATIEGDVTSFNPSTQRAWVTERRHNASTHALINVKTPSTLASSGYTPANGSNPPSATFTTGTGLVTAFEYDGEEVGTVKVGKLGSTTPVVKTVFINDGNAARRVLPAEVTRFRTGTTGADLEEVTTFSYGYDTSSATSAKLDWRRVGVERELVSENGPGSGTEYYSWEFFDDRGQLIVSLDEGGSVTRYEHDENTGTLLKITRNFNPDDVDPTNIPGIRLPTGSSGEPADPFPGLVSGYADGVLITEYGRDLMGRVTKVTRPGGVESWTFRGLDTDAERPGIYYYAMMSLPMQVSGSTQYDGPATKWLLNAANKFIRSEEWDVEDNSSYDPGATLFDYADAVAAADTTILARTVVGHDIAGQSVSTESWWNIADDLSHTTSVEYDAFGREIKRTDGTGTITERVFDEADRLIEDKMGTTSSTPITVARYYYDDDPASSPDHNGVGNGSLTHVELVDGTGSRLTRMYYDSRDRLIATVSDDQPISLSMYDNLDREIQSAVYPEPDTIPTLASMIAASELSALPHDAQSALGQVGSLKRAWYSMSFYSQRGIIFREQAAITPNDASPEFLSWNYWYDAGGNELASWAPNSPGVVREFDAHDRLVKLSLTDRAGDSTAIDMSGRHAQAIDVSGDHVLEEISYTFDTSGPNPSGRLTMITNRIRQHADSTTTGALSANDTKQVTSYKGYLYDAAQRRIAAIDFGTSKGTFSTGAASVPSLSGYTTLPGDLRADMDILFSWTEYNERGLVKDVMTMQSDDPADTDVEDEIRTRYVYDDLGRVAAVIENVDPTGTPATVDWDTGSGRYATSGQATGEFDRDRVTSFQYDASDNVVRRIAHLPDGEIQETQYTYGVTAVGSPGIMDSLVSSNRLLASMSYSDESTGNAGTGAAYTAYYAYNRLGELKGITDQNGTIRKLTRDQAGRVLADTVDTFGSYTVGGASRPIDSYIGELAYAFDSLGRLSTATSYSADLSPVLKNQVKFEYTQLWQIQNLWQEHTGAVSGTSPRVEYAYDSQDVIGSEDNYSRLASVTYPTEIGGSDNTVEYSYSAGINDRISRVTRLDAFEFTNTGMRTLVEYDFIGMNTTATVKLGPTSGKPTLDRTKNHLGEYAAGVYPAFDRFGRVERHLWASENFTGPLGGSPPYNNVPSVPPILEITHSYDRSSNRTSANDDRPGAKLPLRDRRFSYDGLQRLTEEMRTETATSSYKSQHKSLNWRLDMLGNWDILARDADEDGVFFTNFSPLTIDMDGSKYGDYRNHNAANEIESNGLGSPPNYDREVASAGASRYYQYRYDKAGNMTDDRSATSVPLGTALMAGKRMTYDAWNRLVTTKHGSGNGDSTLKDISEYDYNALGWRVAKRFDASKGAYDGVMEQERLFFYDASWRIIEEHIDINANSSPGSDWISQQFWGLRHIDDAIAKRVDRDMTTVGDWAVGLKHWYQITDSQFSVSAILNQELNVYERIEYDAYGNARHRFAGDTTGDGRYSYPPDINVLGGTSTIGDTNYHIDFDVNLDGTINFTGSPNDLTDLGEMGLTSVTALPDNWISDPSSADGPDNSIGYAGYIHNPEREDYTVRFRDYSPELGRWRQRDPIGYHGGRSMYEYAWSSPSRFIDPYGLNPRWDTYNYEQDDDHPSRPRVVEDVDPFNLDNEKKWNTMDFIKYYYRRQPYHRFDEIDLRIIELDNWYKNKPAVQKRIDECRKKAQDLKDAMDSDLCQDDQSRLDEHSNPIPGSEFEDKLGPGFTMGGHRFKCSVRCSRQSGKTKCRIVYEGRDRFKDPLDLINIIPKDIEPGGTPYNITITWEEEYP